MAFKPWWENPLQTGEVRPGPEPGTVQGVVNPLGVPLAPVGRPSEQPVQPYGALASPEPVPAPQPTPTQPVAPQAAPVQPTGPSPAVQGTQVTVTTPQAAPAVAPQPGVQETPVGTLQPGPDGKPQVMLNPVGQEAYRRRIIRRRKEFGKTPFDDDPSAPPPPVEDDGPMFNPITNAWSGLEGLDPLGEA